MKKTFKSLILSFLVLCIYTTASAQTTGTTQFGINVGYNAATVTVGGQTNTAYRSGFNVGVSADYYFNDTWSFKSKLVYDQKGWGEGFLAIGNSSFTTDFQLNYLTIPLMANWHFGHTQNWYLNFGPYVGILLNASLSSFNGNVKDTFNTVDGGLDVGIGVKFPIAKKARLFIELNGQGGVVDVLKDNTRSAIRNSVSNINIGISF